MGSVKKGLALIIANSNYIRQPKLSVCEKDGQRIGNELKKLGFDVEEGYDLDRNNMLQRINSFLTIAERYSTVIVYYSGHGVQIDGQNYLVPIDCTYNSNKNIFIGTSLVNLNTITDYTNEHAEKLSIIILDSCRTSPGFAKGFVGDGLAEVDAGAGNIVAFATAPNTPAGCGADNSYYTESLIKYISMANTKIEDMFKYVRKEVVEKTNGDQIPWESTSLNKAFFFNTMTKDQIQEEIYQSIRYCSCAEMLMALGIKFHMSLSDVMRIYINQRSEKPGGIYFKNNNEFELFVLQQMIDMGFEFEDYRWKYKDTDVIMGDFLHKSGTYTPR